MIQILPVLLVFFVVMTVFVSVFLIAVFYYIGERMTSNIQLLRKGDQYCIRRYWFKIIPMYWYHMGFEPYWTLIPYWDDERSTRAEYEGFLNCAAYRKKFKDAPTLLVDSNDTKVHAEAESLKRK